MEQKTLFLESRLDWAYIFSAILQEKETKTDTPEQTEEKTPQMLRKEVSAIQKVIVIKILKMFLNNLDLLLYLIFFSVSNNGKLNFSR